MKEKWLAALTICSLLLVLTLPVLAQESAVKGALAITVLDPSGAVVPGARLTISGPTGTYNVTTNQTGQYLQRVLNPGLYRIRVEKEGFKGSELRNVEVGINRTSSVRFTLQTGAVTETVEVAATSVAVDTQSTAVSSNLPDTFYEKVPQQRNVSGLFYAAPGVASGGASGAANPSISGGSGLENQYIADGVNITDAAFGGLGVFSRSYLSLGTGINLSFIKEVQVKTAGFEPQYGRATGGIVQIVTKSGSNEFHGAIAGFAQPKGFEERHLNADDPQFARTTLFGRLLHTAGYDGSAELGGYVPGMKNHVFFFGSFNPAWTQRYVLAPTNSGLFNHGEFNLRSYTASYAFKGTLKVNDNNQLEYSIFGDPAHTSTAPNRRLRQDNNTGFSKLEYGTRNMAARYNATLSPTWLFNASATWGHNRFNEIPLANLNEIIDQTQLTCDLPDCNAALLPGGTVRGEFIPVGLGFIEPTTSDTYGLNFDTQKTIRVAGEHTFSVGYRMERPFYDGSRAYSGPTFTIPSDPVVNPTGEGGGSTANALWRLRLGDSTCTQCPLMTVPGFATPQPVFLQIFRSEFGVDNQGFKSFRTSGRYHAAYVNDSWSPNKYVNLNLGLRWEQQRLKGEALSYTFTDNWSPRIGVSVDPRGDRKTKLFANYGRYSYSIPLDMAERSLTNELDMRGLRIAPDFTTVGGRRIVNMNQFGTVTPIVDAAHILNNQPGGIAAAISTSFESTTAIFPGTKMSYLDEFVVGAEHEFPQGVIASVKFVRRDLKRIVEDTGGISPEAALAGVSQVFSITNVNANTDIFSNPIQHAFTPVFLANGNLDPASIPLGCDPTLVASSVTNSLGEIVPPGAVCVEPLAKNGQAPGANVADGVPDGFVNPTRQYTAVEFEVNKAFSRGWLMRANYRVSKLYGNFEGALRNDNGQTDPSISSLFDFTAGDFGLLGDQFKPGVLNSDRRQVLNTFFSYAFDRTALKGLTLGTGIRVQTGTPINELLAHPVYENSGEVPLGGRGKLGRLPITGAVDIHADYAVPITERARLMFGVDLFNIANARRLTFNDQNKDLSFGTPNPDFLKPIDQGFTTQSIGDGFQSPFSARAAVRLVF
ncbi:MAG TPA: carboxypeptidase regulatory-like domain-containing protein [Clostridia bacterium]|nr:carboxypeptidase regulatory-like domain-containing protein [Clostridia bacterium]